jgi:hypothetical protein
MNKIIQGFALVILMLLWNSCSDDSEDVDPCQNGPEVTVDEIRASVEDQDDGEIKVSVSSGASPYMYSIDGQNFQSSNTFSNLAAGSYTITVKDANECTDNVEAIVNEIPVVSFANQVKPIIDADCQVSGCHGSNQNIPDWGSHSNIAAEASAIKARTASKTMPPPASGRSLTDQEIDLISWWVDQGAPDN